MRQSTRNYWPLRYTISLIERKRLIVNTRKAGQAGIRDVVAASTLWAPLVVVATTWAAWRDLLPTNLPRQWGSDGVSSTWPTWVAIALVALICLGSAVTATVALRPGAARSRRTTFLWAGFAAGLACGAWLLVAGSTFSAGANAEPEVGAWPLLLMLLMGYGLIPFLIAHRWVDDAPKPPAVVVTFVPAETGAWITTVTVPLFALTSLALLVTAAVLFFLAVRDGTAGEDLWGAAVLAVLSVPMLAFARLRISADWRGLKVVTGILGISLKTIPLIAIESVRTETLEPMHWGGWGYRFMPGRSAIILRAGPGIIVNLTNGKQFALSLKAPEIPAAVLSTMIASDA
ncbi:hypothetical protein E3T61_20985 [Cryobacterium lactosi]|uniref:DUF1648 domain-containing protein n=1 Tax=Cryobacterium lactosi TaxID=1259202 RepID=A0A4V3IW62_9MICO|nr:hypothetical protein [Cryobacterium lactosi]TFD83514.1 hypothetical protein E3T61_20985 [Cryobacterium lactosi]